MSLVKQCAVADFAPMRCCRFLLVLDYGWFGVELVEKYGGYGVAHFDFP